MIYFYELIVWPIQRTGVHAFDAFHQAIFDFDKVFGPLNLPEDIKKHLEGELKKKFTPKPIKVKAIFELKCLSRNGIEDIKEALRQGEKVGNKDIPIIINLIAPPKYLIHTNTINKKKGIDLVTKGLNMIKEYITARQGTFDIREAPEITGGKEKAIQNLLKESRKPSAQYEEEDNEEGMGDQEIEGL